MLNPEQVNFEALRELAEATDTKNVVIAVGDVDRQEVHIASRGSAASVAEMLVNIYLTAGNDVREEFDNMMAESKSRENAEAFGNTNLQ